MINIVLYQPEIPQNTGNIIRTVANTGITLHIIKPLGFRLSNKHLKRAGLDYFDLADVRLYENFDELIESYPDSKFYFASSKAKKFHSDVEYEEGCFIVFGRETSGLPDNIMEEYKDDLIRIPMIKNERARCLNLSNSVAIIVYEALRQLNFRDMV